MHWDQNVCRICGEISDTCHLIYDKNPNNTNIENQIKRYLKLELFKDDFKPKQICNCCLMKLNDFEQFLNICHATDQKFESILLHHHQSNNQSYEIIDYTQQKMSVIVTPKTTIDQLDCNDIDLYKETVLPLESCSINEHEMLEIVENAAGYTNLTENLDYLNTSAYNLKNPTDFYQPESTVLRHSSDYQQQQQNNSGNVVINYSCQTLKSSLAEDPTSLYCKTENFDSQTINQSIVNQYPNISYPNYDYVAPPPEKSITQLPPPSAPSTINGKPPEKSFECPHCGKKFKRRISLNGHIAIHTKIRPFVCDICKKSYAIRSDLTNHQKIHTDRNKCKYCSSSFTAPSKLLRHMRIHTKDKPFVCDYKNCNKSFSDKRNLDQHKQIHSDELNFNCKICWKAFKTKQRLKQHEKIHNASDLYKCEVCSNVYKFKSSLSIHLKKHNGYFCNYCKKNCGGFVKLIKHKRICTMKADSK